MKKGLIIEKATLKELMEEFEERTKNCEVEQLNTTYYRGCYLLNAVVNDKGSQEVTLEDRKTVNKLMDKVMKAVYASEKDEERLADVVTAAEDLVFELQRVIDDLNQGELPF